MARQATNPTEHRIERAAVLRWVPIAKTRVSDRAQRELRTHWVEHLSANFDLEAMGVPTVSFRDGHYYVVDGQHRVEALRLMGWGDQQIQCWVYEGLNEAEEAELFLQLNHKLTTNAYDEFQVAVTARRQTEVDIERLVRASGLTISRTNTNGIIAVGTLRKVYDRTDPVTFAKTLRICVSAYGDAGTKAEVIDGIGHLCGRYNGLIDEDVVAKRLGDARGGMNGLLNQADILRKQTGSQKGVCVAAAAVDIINSGKGGRKLPSWWVVAGGPAQ